jgi:hypothetical protein
VRGSSSSSFKRMVVALALALALGAVVLLAGWPFFARRHARWEVSPPPEETATSAAPERANTNATPPPRRSQPPATSTPTIDEHVAADGLGFMPPHEGDARPPGPLHPHPITPSHQRLFAENRIAFALDDATDAKDLAAMKKLLDQYRRDFPEDQWQLQGGYAVIIECLEHPGAESRAAAERWLDENNGSTVKRSVLRNCIEPQQP